MSTPTTSNLAKAVIIAGGTEVPVKFNPTEYNLNKSVTFVEKSIPGFTTPVTQFGSGESETLSMELFFDAYEEKNRDVRKYTEKLRDLLKVDGAQHAPPVCRFVWGSLDFTCLLQSANTTFTMFLDSGVPVRARMDVTFQEYKPPRRQREENPRSSPDKSKLHRVTEDETLWVLADEEYGDPTRWRAIAEANGIDNPRTLRPGALLVVPTLES
ncbi:LysM peptidoglycan-binding domain-containing protein [Halobium salinum]|uniref:LysM peptidoglycan-binding domain-containing protein n=1 Tax=Halobium salinum TaxID=1364940 RepID=A0ABD5PIM7_9EURY|nr:LysM peptidoglycan-binding domain-containing protein [Halobium salinum]